MLHFQLVDFRVQQQAQLIRLYLAVNDRTQTAAEKFDRMFVRQELWGISLKIELFFGSNTCSSRAIMPLRLPSMNNSYNKLRRSS